MNKLNVITTISNPCNYNTRYKLAKDFIKYISKNPMVELYVVELAYSCNNKYVVTSKINPRHLQLQTEVPFWHKENLINIGVKNLLPDDWKSFAWIDCDIEFLNNDWASTTLDYLDSFDVLQMFSFCHDLDKNLNVKKTFSSLCQNYCLYGGGRKLPDAISGFAWAIRREFYERLGGLFEYGIVGGADLLMYNCFSQEFSKEVLSKYFFETPNYKKIFIEYIEKSKNCKLGFLPLLIKHYFHGDRKNRKYSSRHKILSKHYFDIDFLKKDEKGILVPSDKFSKNLEVDLMNYFLDREEDLVG